MRVKQDEGKRGSLKWIQLAINRHKAYFDSLVAPHIARDAAITWLSPIQQDGFAEYRDAAFLKLIGQEALTEKLKAYWPARGPQWDALGLAGETILLVEAKAHIPEMMSDGCKASDPSLAIIRDAFSSTMVETNTKAGIDWTGPLYQYANRLAHLHFFKKNGVKAKLVLCCFVGDNQMNGGASEAEWRGALKIADHLIGLRERHPLAADVIHIFPYVDKLV